MIAAIVERLSERAMPPLTSVGVAEDLEALAAGTAPRNGACFVLPFQDRPEPNTLMSGAIRQRIEVLFLVAFVVRRHGDAKGAARAGSFDDLKAATEAALFGWEPGEGSDPCELAAGRSSAMGNGVTIYVQTWRTTRWLRA